MKKSIAIFSFFSLILLLGNSLQAQCDPKKQGTPFPAISVTDIKGKEFTIANVPLGQPIIVIYFDPFCDHCQQQAQWINEKISSFKGVTVLWMTWGEMEDLKNFPVKYFPGVVKHDMYFTKDTKFKFDDWFGYSDVPSIYVYNAARTRTMCFKKETPVADLLKYVK